MARPTVAQLARHMEKLESEVGDLTYQSTLSERELGFLKSEVERLKKHVDVIDNKLMENPPTLVSRFLRLFKR